MKLAAIIGDPIGHSLSPAIYGAAFPAMGIDATYEAWQTPAADVPRTIQRLRDEGILGMNVTVPHKSAVLPLLDDVEPTARAIGAVNCIVKDGARLTGHNTDRYGFLRSLREAGCEPAGLRVLVLGVGGSARAVGFGLLQSGVASLTLAGRNPQRVAATAADLRSHGEGAVAIAEQAWSDEALVAAAGESDLVVNCTPVGMAHTAEQDASPLPSQALRPGLWVYDLVYNPRDTRLLRDAASAGARPIGGLEMLIYQAEGSLRLWTGREPGQGVVDIIRTALLAALAQREGA